VIGTDSEDAVRATSPFITHVYHPSTGKLSVASGATNMSCDEPATAGAFASKKDRADPMTVFLGCSNTSAYELPATQ